MTYTTKQQTFIDAALAGRNIFLTGKAGTGKSFAITSLIEALSETGRKVAAVAPTGIAANNISGQTIHSLFAINPYGIMDFESCNFVQSERRRLLNKIETLIIDEVSMLRPDILDAMHWTLRRNGCKGLDTKQVIFVGDLKQLMPVLSDNDRSVLFQSYDAEDFTQARIYKKLAPEVIELDEVRRQNDTEFIDHLNIIREGGRSEYFRRFAGLEPGGIILAPHNATVMQYNAEGLARQPGDLFEFEADVDGNASADEFNLESTVRVKNGCKIMYLVNSKDNPLVNGTLGMFVSHAGDHYIRVNETDFALSRVTLVKKKYVYNPSEDKLKLVEVGSITQYPIKLAYALSIHKSQGMTFDDVTVDLRRPCFQPGQMYVALSRVRTPAGLRIITN